MFDFSNYKISVELKNVISEYYNMEVDDLNIHQNFNEVELLLKALSNKKFNHLVEIGSASGGSLWIYSKMLASKEAKIQSIEQAPNTALKYILAQMRDQNYKIDLIEAISFEIHDKIEPTIDFLHIDGRHEYYDVELDFRLFYPKVTKGGVIVLHDTALHAGCIEFKEELTKKYNTQTFVDSNNDDFCGITLVIKD